MLTDINNPEKRVLELEAEIEEALQDIRAFQKQAIKCNEDYLKLEAENKKLKKEIEILKENVKNVKRYKR